MPELTNSDLLALAVAYRDIAQFTKERLDKLIIEQQLKQNLIEQPPPKQPQTLKENQTFDCLTYEDHKGTKLGDFQVAAKPSQNPEKWLQAQSALQANNATINNRYHEPAYIFSYWLFNEKIYRRKLKAPQP